METQHITSWKASELLNSIDCSWQAALLEALQGCPQTITICWAGICPNLMAQIAGQSLLPFALQPLPILNNPALVYLSSMAALCYIRSGSFVEIILILRAKFAQR